LEQPLEVRVDYYSREKGALPLTGNGGGGAVGDLGRGH